MRFSRHFAYTDTKSGGKKKGTIMAGRPSEALEWLSEDNLTRIRGWARDGLTDKQIAEKKIGISERTFCNWKKDYPAILSALKEGKHPVDIEVEDSLLKSAKGFTVTVRKAIKLRTVKEKDGMKLTEERIEYVDEEQYIKPEVVAQIYWAKNRMPDKWRDKPIAENSEEVDRIVDRMADILDGVSSVIK